MSRTLEKLVREYAQKGGALSDSHRLVLWAKALSGGAASSSDLARWLSPCTSDRDRSLLAKLAIDGAGKTRKYVLEELQRAIDNQTLDEDPSSSLSRSVYDFHDLASLQMQLETWNRERAE